jgi:hypothetical protein
VSDTIETMIDRLTDRQRYEFALACGRRVQHLMCDSRSLAALDTRERWLRGETTDDEMDAAVDAARAASRAAARDAARDAASAAVWAAALDSARDAASAAAWSAAWVWSRNAARAASLVTSPSAAEATWNSESAWQLAELKRMLGEVKS